MTDSEGRRRQPAGLVLSGVGAQPELAARVAAAVDRLAARSGWPVRRLDPGLAPPQALAALGEGRATGERPAWLAPLRVDPGLSQEAGGSWAEALGAWRQPTLLLLDAPQLATGWPAAATALLRQAGVPLAGLIQWGGAWERDRRREEDLPWLGRLAERDGDAEVAEAEIELLEALARRWRALDLL